MFSQSLNIIGRIPSTLASTVRAVSTTSHLGFKVTQHLWAEPLKKKKRIDPSIIRAREERRRKKIEKQIRRLEKNARQPKPIDECEIPLVLLTPEGMKIHERKLAKIPDDTVDARVRLVKEWVNYRYKQSIVDIKTIDSVIYAQNKALDELRQESEELYQEAIEIDPGFLPFSTKGPVITPPIEGYSSPDGEYIDVTKKWT